MWPEISNTKQMTPNIAQDSSIHIGIIGLGPKGFYGLERIIAHLSQWKDRPVVIHAFNKSKHFGSGDTYRTDQPRYLKMNITCGDIDIRYKQSPQSLIHDLPCFIEWARVIKGKKYKEDDIPARADVGAYFEYAFHQLVHQLPDHIEVKTYEGTVKSLEHSKNSCHIEYVNNYGKATLLPISLHNVLLATGHCAPAVRNKNANLQEQSPSYISFPYPVDNRLSHIKPGSKVGIKGMGLTFIDVALALTEGRGGLFVQKKKGYTYVPSGNEPQCMYPFSRNGLPIMTRPVDQIKDTPQLQFFTPDFVRNLSVMSGADKIDFEKILWPVIQHELTYAYYKVLFENFGLSERWELAVTAKDMYQLIDEFHDQRPYAVRFDAKTFLFPTAQKLVSPGSSYHDHIVSYIKNNNKEAAKGVRKSPQAATTQVWQYISPWFANMYRFGGLTPSSHETFDLQFRSALNRITYGPPLENMKKIMALVKGGFLNFGVGPSPDILQFSTPKSITIRSKNVNHQVRTDYLVNARIPKQSISPAQDDLYGKLLKKGSIRLFANRDVTHNAVYYPGCPDMTLNGHLVDRQGNINECLAITGTPTEGITYDNDTISPYRNSFVNQWACKVLDQIKASTHE